MTVNYEEVQRVYRLEKNTPTLTEINDDFFAQSSSLIDSVEERHKESLARFFGEIIGSRRRKILLHALRMEDANTPPTNTTKVEEEFYKDLVAVLTRHKQKLLSTKKPLQEPTPKPTPTQEKNTVRILRALPQIVGPDGETHGPFMEGEVVNLPKQNTEILIKQGAAEKTEGV